MNYHKYKCEECGKELNKVRNTDLIEFEDGDSQWLAHYDCPDGHGSLVLECAETVSYDFVESKEYSHVYVENKNWRSNKLR